MIAWDARQQKLRATIAACHERLAARPGDDFDASRWDAVCDSGILRLPFEARYGGLGEDLLTTMYVLEDLGHGCRDGGLTFSICTHMVSVGVPLERFGSTELRERHLPQICAGSAIGAHAITEPQGGSDVLAMRTTAVEHGDHYVLNGRKAYTTNGPIADLLVVYARTRPESGPFALTAFLIERDAPGLRCGGATPKLGLDSSPIGEVVLEDCEVDAGHVIGRPGNGLLVLDYVMKWEILCSFIASVGAMRHRLERCVTYARSRRQFGRPIGSYQAIGHRLVDLSIAIETARRWLYDAGAQVAAGQQATAEVATAKLLASEANVASALTAIQILGAHGYTTEGGVESDLRDAIASTIYSGTSEIQRNKLARLLGLGEETATHRESAGLAVGV